MKLLILSDSHGDTKSVREAIQKELPFDECIHCGDGINDITQSKTACSFIINSVIGNVDRAHGIRGTGILECEFDGIKAVILHGDCHSAKSTFIHIRAEGIRRSARIVFFGHTHEPLIRDEQSLFLFNPGSIRNGTYGIVTIENGNFDCEIKTLSK